MTCSEVIQVKANVNYSCDGLMKAAQILKFHLKYYLILVVRLLPLSGLSLREVLFYTQLICWGATTDPSDSCLNNRLFSFGIQTHLNKKPPFFAYLFTL